MKEIIESIAKSLVDKPEEVQVIQVDGDKTTVLELRVAKEDLGKVIGKRGATALSMRVIINAIARKRGKNRSVLEIVE